MDMLQCRTCSMLNDRVSRCCVISCVGVYRLEAEFEEESEMCIALFFIRNQSESSV